MRTSDVLARLGGFLMLFTSAWNLLWAGLMFLTLIWVLVGALWLVPMALAVVEGVLGLTFLIVGHNKGVAAGPILGIGIAMCNLNLIGVALEFVVLCLMIGSYVARSSEASQTERLYAA